MIHASLNPDGSLRYLRWQLDRLAELIEWDDYVAARVIDGTLPFHRSMMEMRLETGQYDGTVGDLLYQLDVLIQAQIDPREDVSR
jgi:hypothetical protein